KEWVGLCPFHNDTKLGSFTVNDAKAIYKCFTCGASGDHFTYLKERKGTE
ncbi:CHC2 zinc finger domain-containing protein, partial [Serratia marcescens]